MFRAIVCPSPGVQDCDLPHAVNHSLALLVMGKELPEPYCAVLKIDKLLLLNLVGSLLYHIDDARSNTNQMTKPLVTFRNFTNTPESSGL